MSTRPLSVTQVTVAGNLKATAGYLYWLLVCNQAAAAGTAILNNANAGVGNELLRVEVPANDTKFILFGQPIYCNTGIRIGTLDATMFVTGGYD